MTQAEPKHVKILIADDDKHTWRLIEVMCRGQTYDLVFASNGREALEYLQKDEDNSIRMVLSDVMMPLMGGEDLLAAIKKHAPHIPVVLMTSHGSIDSAVRFLNAGAVDYIPKPLHKDVLLHRISAVLDTSRLAEEIDQLREELGRSKGLNDIVGQSPQLMDVLKKLPSIAKTDASVIIYGDSGTGKELIAKGIHQLSDRSHKPMVTMNCGALPENLLETELFGYKKGSFTDAHQDYDGLVSEANEGTLFLDEIGEVPLKLQVKLLRFLQEKEFKPIGSTKVSLADVRFISATNRDLLAETKRGEFREDLYYRLNIIPITLPPLRDRKEDIPLLADYFLRKFAKQTGKVGLVFAPRAIEKMLDYPWPGNIRELENKILQIVVMSDRSVIMPEQVTFEENEPSEPGGIHLSGELGTFKEEKSRILSEFEQSYINRMLSLYMGNISRAAKASGMDRKNFWQKMQRYGINARDFAQSTLHR